MVNAICILKGDEGVTGVVRFKQESAESKILISAEFNGLPEGKHGFHIHEFGDNTNGCLSTGGHFNPLGVNHGDRTAAVRHVGDMGNVVSQGAEQVTKVEFEDHLITLFGPLSAIGRTVVIHGGEDDLGLGGNAGSLANGNAGSRSACGVIGITN
ncbi:hypothetical protein BB561_005131 [Smittium simulii]|uniref:Superoxide dismutase [Cu-Zn] n=1 Tax=Smittium simulii TaxID=133385 RepID=A0A2T9YC16_9FUNG|nr:hypothetical protein BB561_005131 [Smittium simulii]